MSGWIGVDLDGTLATYYEWQGPYHIGAPIPKMVERVKQWRSQGITVKIMTARANIAYYHQPISDWCLLHLGERLEITCQKDFAMMQLWDDRAVRVEKNTGEIGTYHE